MPRHWSLFTRLSPRQCAYSRYVIERNTRLYSARTGRYTSRPLPVWRRLDTAYAAGSARPTTAGQRRHRNVGRALPPAFA